MTVPRVILDCDPGIDDAIALLLLAGQHRRELLRLDGVVAVGGNVPLELTGRNARFVLDEAGLKDVPVFVGRSKPYRRINHAPDARGVHGEDGLGGLAGPDLRDPDGSEDGVDALIRLCTQPGDGPVVLLAAGPLTNVAHALDRRPGLARAIDRMIVMGGAFGAPGGNVTAYAEFNFWADPAAAHRVCASDLPLEIVPLDVTTTFPIARRDVAAAGVSGLAARLLHASIERAGGTGCHMHDALAAALILEPGLVLHRALICDVLTGDEAPGHVAWRAERHGDEVRVPAEVALTLDADSARDSILSGLV